MIFILSEVVTIKTKRYWKELFFSWFCGVTGGGLEGKQRSQEEQDKEAADEEIIRSLKQDSTSKIILHVFLFIIVGIAVFLYCFFSLWRYTVP